MKLSVAYLCFGLLVFVFIADSCSTKEEVALSDPTLIEIQRIHPAGEAVASDLMKSLKQELQNALGEGDFAGAVETCKGKAMPLTEEILQSNFRILDLKRVTTRPRNPENAPDRIELAALDYFRSRIENGQDLPPSYIQKATSGSEVWFNFYKPVYTAGLCLTCHGEPDRMSEDVLTTIDELYPNDKATGYRNGDFRGLIKVSLKE